MNQQQKRWKILLVGDSCLDEYRIGTVDRLSPEAPVPVVKLVEQYTLPGMAANVEVNLRYLGAEVDFCTNSEVVTKTRYIDRRSGQHLIRVDSEPAVQEWSRFTPNALAGYDCVVVSDYCKGFLSYNDIRYIIDGATCPVFIDTKKTDLARFSAPHCWLKINEVEYRARISDPANMVVTLGAAGAKVVTGGTEAVYGVEPAEVVDVCGCGDTFLAALAVKYLEAGSITAAVHFANRAARVTVQHRGNYAPKMEELIWHD